MESRSLHSRAALATCTPCCCRLRRKMAPAPAASNSTAWRHETTLLLLNLCPPTSPPPHTHVYVCGLQGYCSDGKCLKWPVLLGEFSAPHGGAPGDAATLEGLVQYINNAGDARDGRHTAITMWFFCEWSDPGGAVWSGAMLVPGVAAAAGGGCACCGCWWKGMPAQCVSGACALCNASAAGTHRELS